MTLLIALITGVLHTLFGPDHYLPIIALAKDRGWSAKKSISATLIIGVLHLLSAMVIVLIVNLFWSEIVDLIVVRLNQLIAWLLISVGLIYLLAGTQYKLIKNLKSGLILTVFLVGPCEPLVPLLLYPGINSSWSLIALSSFFFGLGTLGVMVGIVVGIVAGSYAVVPRIMIPRWGMGIVLIGCGVLCC